MDRSGAIKKRAQLLLQKGQVDAALVEFDKLFDSGDKDPYDFILVADVLAKRGSMQDAVRRYRQAIHEYTKAELFKNAIAVCKKIARISKEDLEIHRALGDLYSKEGLNGDAQIHYLEFAEGSIRRKDYTAALDAIDQVLGLSPDNVEISEKYIEIATRTEKPERAGRELLRRAARAEQRGQTAEAGQLRHRATKIAPGVTADVPSPSRIAPAESTQPPLLYDAVIDVVEKHSPYKPTVRNVFEELEAERLGGSRTTAPASPEFASVNVGEGEEADPAPQRHEDLAAGHLSAGNRELAVEEFWKAAEVSFFRGDLLRTRTLLESLLQVLPGHEAALRRLVDITAQSNDPAAEARARFDLAELYLSHEEWALCRTEYLRVLSLDPTNERARVRIQRLDSITNGDGPSAPIDLDALQALRPASSVRIRDDQPTSLESLVDLEEIIDEFKAGVSNSISSEDHESHYDLGMAYMEMGLHDEAIGEFQVAFNGGPMELKCLEMIALCYLEKDEPAAAARELSHALELPGHGPEETISLRYNLGTACERLGSLDKALQYFEEVYLLNMDFLKVASKVRELKLRIAAPRGS